jgi:hypothetical protein
MRRRRTKHVRAAHAEWQLLSPVIRTARASKRKAPASRSAEDGHVEGKQPPHAPLQEEVAAKSHGLSLV